MAIKINWQKFPPNNNTKDAEDPHFFPRIRNTRTITDNELLDHMSLHSGKHRSYYMPALGDLSQAIAETLLEGNMVKLFDLGTFRLRLGTGKQVTSRNRSDMSNIIIQGVNFTPSEEFLQRLQSPTFQWTPEHTTPRHISEEDIIESLKEWFETHQDISRQKFEHLFQFSRTTATNRLNQLIKRGLLKKFGNNRETKYVPNALI